MFYGDTALFGAYDATGVRAQVLRRRPRRVRLGFTLRPGKRPDVHPETIRIIDRLPITADERERIDLGNAVQLLKLAP